MTHNRIITPTEREKKAILTFAWTGNKLDPVIEAAEKRDSFFVSGWDFTEQTMHRLGIKVATVSNRQRIRDAFSKANEAIVREIVEMQWRERKAVK